MVLIVTLKDGYQVVARTVDEVINTFKDIQNSHPNTFLTLVRNMQNENAKLQVGPSSNSSVFVVQDKAREDIRRIVLNSLEVSGNSFKWVSPFKKPVAKI
jgi:hypothetical protein